MSEGPGGPGLRTGNGRTVRPTSCSKPDRANHAMTVILYMVWSNTHQILSEAAADLRSGRLPPASRSGALSPSSTRVFPPPFRPRGAGQSRTAVHHLRRGAGSSAEDGRGAGEMRRGAVASWTAPRMRRTSDGPPARSRMTRREASAGKGTGVGGGDGTSGGGSPGARRPRARWVHRDRPRTCVLARDRLPGLSTFPRPPSPGSARRPASTGSKSADPWRLHGPDFEVSMHGTRAPRNRRDTPRHPIRTAPHPSRPKHASPRLALDDARREVPMAPVHPGSAARRPASRQNWRPCETHITQHLMIT